MNSKKHIVENSTLESNINFISFYINENRKKDIDNQKELIETAKRLKSSNRFDKKDSWLREKLEKNITKSYRGQFREKDYDGILDEIIDGNNSSALLLWSKSPRKQGVEDIQQRYLLKFFDLNLKCLPKSGKDSVRYDSMTGELIYGSKSRSQKYRKTLDGKITNLSVDNFTFQKVTTDDGGSTNTVEDEVYSTIDSALIKQEKYIIFILDGDYWIRPNSENRLKTRFEKIHEKSTDKIIICSSDTILHELDKRKIKIIK